MGRCQEGGDHLLAAEELAYFLPEFWLRAAKFEQAIREDHVAARALLSHKFGREEFGQKERADVTPLFPIVTAKSIHLGAVERVALDRTKRGPIDRVKEFFKQIDPRAGADPVDGFVDLAPVERQLMGCFGQRPGASRAVLSIGIGDHCNSSAP